MPKFGFQQPILGGGEEVEAQIQELRVVGVDSRHTHPNHLHWVHRHKHF